MINPDHRYFRELGNQFIIPKLFDGDPGWKTFGSGINVPDLQHCYHLPWFSIFLYARRMIIYRGYSRGLTHQILSKVHRFLSAFVSLLLKVKASLRFFLSKTSPGTYWG